MNQMKSRHSNGATPFVLDTQFADGMYETALAHPLYNGGDWIVLQRYDNWVQAQFGHIKWAGIMAHSTPDELYDLGPMVGEDDIKIHLRAGLVERRSRGH